MPPEVPPRAPHVLVVAEARRDAIALEELLENADGVREAAHPETLRDLPVHLLHAEGEGVLRHDSPADFPQEEAALLLIEGAEVSQRHGGG